VSKYEPLPKVPQGWTALPHPVPKRPLWMHSKAKRWASYRNWSRFMLMGAREMLHMISTVYRTTTPGENELIRNVIGVLDILIGEWHDNNPESKTRFAKKGF